jgi:uncharacterized repeat protein (TIGR04061 family)
MNAPTTAAAGAAPGRQVKDSELLARLADPAARGDFPPGCRAHVRIDISIRAYWHTLFDICPGLLDIADPDGMAIFAPFMDWARRENLTMGWSFYIWVGRWLAQSPWRERLDEELTQALLSASAARWAVLDRSADVGVVLGRRDSDDWIIGWKPNTLAAGRRVELVSLDGQLPRPAEDVGVFHLAGYELDSFPGWLALPR